MYILRNLGTRFQTNTPSNTKDDSKTPKNELLGEVLALEGNFNQNVGYLFASSPRLLNQSVLCATLVEFKAKHIRKQESVLLLGEPIMHFEQDKPIHFLNIYIFLQHNSQINCDRLF